MPKDLIEETEEIQGYRVFTAPSLITEKLDQLRDTLAWCNAHKVDVTVTPGPAGHRIEWNAR